MKRAILFIILMQGFAFAQSSELGKHIHKGNEFYRQNDFDKAAAEYESALAIDPNNTTAQYNLAAVRARQARPADAGKLYNKIVSSSPDKSMQAKSQYNQGALLSQEKKLLESIEAYKKALRLDPDDKEARENLQKALMEQKKKTPPPEKNEKKKKQEEQKQQKPQPKMSQKEAEQRLDLLEQKEKEIQLRQQKAKSSSGGSQTKDW